MKKSKTIYSDDFKLKVVQEYLTTGVSRQVLQKKYGLRGNGYLYNWMRKFGLTKSDQEQPRIQSTMTKETGKTSKERELEVKIKQLEKDLEYERLRGQALDTMITIAERDLKIPIRKKPGAKQ
jgi:transposase-like protein